MTTPLTKLIAENKWRPIAEAPRDGSIILGREKEGEPNMINWNTDYNFWQPSGVEGLEIDRLLTHFRPLPDDRLALVCDAFLGAICEVLGTTTACHIEDTLSRALVRATVIAEGKE